jgi:hypothetical protein
MGVRVVWLDSEQTILSYVFEGNWTWDEMRLAIEQANACMDMVVHRVDFIADTRNSGFMPTDVIANVRQLALSVPPHPNYGGTTVFVGSNALVRTLMNMVVHIYRQLNQDHTFVFVGTLEEAYAIISEHRARRHSA